MMLVLSWQLLKSKMAHNIYHTEGFILEKKDFKEADNLLFILTKDFGVIPVLALGLRRLPSKLRYQTVLFNHANVSLVKGREFWRLIAVEETDLSVALKAETKKVIYLQSLSLLRHLFQGEEDDQIVFNDFKQGLVFLAEKNLSQSACKNFECILVLRMLKLLGYLKDESSLRPFLVFSDWSNEIIDAMADKQRLAVSLINSSLAGASV